MWRLSHSFGRNGAEMNWESYLTTLFLASWLRPLTAVCCDGGLPWSCSFALLFWSHRLPAISAYLPRHRAVKFHVRSERELCGHYGPLCPRAENSIGGLPGGRC